MATTCWPISHRQRRYGCFTPFPSLAGGERWTVLPLSALKGNWLGASWTHTALLPCCSSLLLNRMELRPNMHHPWSPLDSRISHHRKCLPGLGPWAQVEGLCFCTLTPILFLFATKCSLAQISLPVPHLPLLTEPWYGTDGGKPLSFLLHPQPRWLLLACQSFILNHKASSLSCPQLWPGVCISLFVISGNLIRNMSCWLLSLWGHP